MDAQKLRSSLALILVGGFFGVTFLIVILMVIGILQPSAGTEILKSFSSICSGFVGIVIGYYFTKNGSS